MEKKYNIGLDIGTTSVGWAVVETDTQKIIKKGRKTGRKSLWGVRLFEEATTAEQRRNFRSTRRRLDRRRERIKLLQEEFKEEISKVDKTFFQKMSESKYNSKDSLNKTIKISGDENKKIVDYNKKYRTIYHLRNRLITDPSKEDIRLVYLALHHIIKYRGNFLYEKEKFNISEINIEEQFIEIFKLFVDLMSHLGIDEEFEKLVDFKKISDLIIDLSKNDLKIELKNELKEVSNNNNFASEMVKLILGYKFSIKKLFMLEDLQQDITITFAGSDFDDKYDELAQISNEVIEVLSQLKELYNAIFLRKIFKGNSCQSKSALMIDRYNVHRKDLKFLKRLFASERNYYNCIFKTKLEKGKTKMCLYDKYIHNKIAYEEFIKELDKYLIKLFEMDIEQKLLDEYSTVIKIRINNGEFLPRITDPENGIYPYQINCDELVKIIENQGKYYNFLLDKVNDEYKIVKLLEFKIPYYVGPLVSDQQSKNAWLERKESNIKITPYNFDDIVDKDKTAEKFIKRMISHCTYLLDEYAMPNMSILYSRYKVLNELKQIKVNGDKLTNDLQHKIMKELFLKTTGTITNSKFRNYLLRINAFPMYDRDINITGYSGDERFANNMQSYYDFFSDNGIFANTSYTEEDAEVIIEWITIFTDKDILKKKIIDSYCDLNDEQIKKIILKKYKGWGNLSKKLITTKYYCDKETNLYKSILDLMYETDNNFMQIINDVKYDFQKMIKEYNSIEKKNKIDYSLVNNLATSPATKKGVYQALLVVEEIVDYMKCDPQNIIIEMARSEEKKQRKDDRKKYLLNLYEKSKDKIDDYNQIVSQLKETEKIDSQKMFLYFIQEGKCLYCKKPLNIEELNSGKYEIDHIVPRTLIKDDSIDNKALVCRSCNQVKKDDFILPSSYRNYEKIEYWRHLKSINLISAKKFYNLTRKEYSIDDINGFINRQLVETRQITKHVANILNTFYNKTNIVYLKANLSHNYRECYELFKFRGLNDYHHAHDAYLAAVLGEYKEKHMKKEIDFNMVKELNSRLRELGDYHKLKYGFVINSLDSKAGDIVNEISKNLVDENTGEILFDAKEFNQNVENTLYQNDILISRKSEIKTGQFFNQNILSRGLGKIKIKDNMPTELYGGYSSVKVSYLVLIEYKNKKKIIGIPIEIVKKSKQDTSIKQSFIREHLKLKETEKFKILKDRIPLETLIKYRGHYTYIKGYSISHKDCELSNAFQLKIPRDKMIKWKYVFNKIINGTNIPTIDKKPTVQEELLLKQAREVLEFLLQQKDRFPMFINSLNKIEDNINYSNLDFEQLSKIIKEILIIYRCDSVDGNLKEFGLGDRIGRLSGNNITSGCLIFKSITGIREDKYEF